MALAEIGIIGLGVMGRMLARNMARHGLRVAGYDLNAAKVADFAAAGPGLHACATLPEFLAALESPRRIMLMVPAGAAVDAVIESLRPQLAPGDLLIDGGNSFFKDTERRHQTLTAAEILFSGTGVSGGEYGALWGPAIMPGGQPEAWQLMQPGFTAIAAQVNGEPCVTYCGPRGAGHYVKMVHNGIEYADMQLIAEVYDLLHRGCGVTNAELHEIFADWNTGELQSYLIEITAAIFARLDPDTGQPLVNVILDEAQHKGTGKWTSQEALELGAPIPTINAAVEARFISAQRAERVAAAAVLPGPSETTWPAERATVIETVRAALYAAKLCAYAQGFALLRSASAEYGYTLNYGELARIWRGGCIIRAAFLDKVRAAFEQQPELPNLLMAAEFSAAVAQRQSALRQVVQWMAARGIPALAFSSALAYYDAYRSARLPANLIQAQRDYFGAHTYRRLDRAGSYHTEWQEES